MEKLTKLKSKISINPENLNGDIKKTVHEKLEEKYLYKCSEEYGYILEIVDIFFYETNMISPITSLPIFEPEFTVKNLKPEIGQRVEGVVVNIKEKFIIVRVMDRINILVNEKELRSSKFIYNKVGTCFKNKKISIRQGDSVSLEIISVRYKKDYVCLGNKVKIAKDYYAY
jgi:DNA-directed RNA polymerase subunit E'/Rpb7